jgi:hypothetical protein
LVVSQSNYIPWKGFFDLIRGADAFVVLDRVQFTKGDWRNRNLIKTAQGLRWLTIPVGQRGATTKAIDEMVIAGDWASRHWGLIEGAYRTAPCFRELKREIGPLYEQASRIGKLSSVNRLFLESISRRLGISTPFLDAGGLPDHPDRTRRLIGLCRAVGADTYLTGPAARGYLVEEAFAEAGITLQYAEYADYPTYPQLQGSFEHRVSILDLIAHVGFAEAPRHMRNVVPSSTPRPTPCEAVDARRGG